MDYRRAFSHRVLWRLCRRGWRAAASAVGARSLACAAVATQAQRQDARSSATPWPSTAPSSSPRGEQGRAGSFASRVRKLPLVQKLVGEASTATDTLATTAAAGPWPTR